ncbi:hypothetical protein CMI37_11115 [Candidatus Pacearchaeota archaeon]|jgi:hypothetical protein|nr:hypothetical protein [Candidatus Pacearchaeota archaeon]|tara:strand:+ start:241 stop:585 length:345 start_codon:yes stop_codon:yes gene_type:complete
MTTQTNSVSNSVTLGKLLNEVREQKAKQKYLKLKNSLFGEGFDEFCSVAGLSERERALSFDSNAYKKEFIGLMMLKASQQLQKDRFVNDLTKGLTEQKTLLETQEKATEKILTN